MNGEQTLHTLRQGAQAISEGTSLEAAGAVISSRSSSLDTTPTDTGLMYSAVYKLVDEKKSPEVARKELNLSEVEWAALRGSFDFLVAHERAVRFAWNQQMVWAQDRFKELCHSKWDKVSLQALVQLLRVFGSSGHFSETQVKVARATGKGVQQNGGDPVAQLVDRLTRSKANVAALTPNGHLRPE